jgi:hypothetical protein
MPCSGFTINRCFGGTVSYSEALLARVNSSTLKMQAACSSETSVYNRPTWRHISEDGIP